FFEHTVWACGCWKCGKFRHQFYKERHIGRMCGLKLIYRAKREGSVASCAIHGQEKPSARED
ncbi:hypothetical protein DER44DRAFT_638783, partial [Fusarium oxysporum]